MSDERARLRALAEKAANPELDHWQRTHALWELRAALSPPVVLGLLDAADRAEAAERECEKAERLWKESSIDASRKFDTIKGLERAVEIERARAERLEEALTFYADGEHLYGSLRDDWDECSDTEYAGLLCPPDPVSDESWGVEDGSTARAALDAARAGDGS